MPTTIFSQAPVSLSVGTHGPFTSSITSFNPAGYQLTFTNAADWPTSGDVCLITIEISSDGGTTWRFDASSDFGPGPWAVKGGGTTNNAVWTVGQPQGNRVRATIQMFQAATLGVVIAAL